MDTKKLIENIIEDIVGDAPITKIILKSQAIAFSLKNKEFSDWIIKEQNGYDNAKEIPEFRIIGCSLIVDASFPFGRMAYHYRLPVDMIRDELVRDYLRHARLTESITSLELMASNDDGKQTLAMPVPGFMWREINNCLEQDGNVLSAYQEFSHAAVRGVVDAFKSKLLQFFLELSSQMDIDLDVITNNEKISHIMNQTITAGIINTGSGSVTANSATILTGEIKEVTITPQLKSQIEEILLQIEAIKSEIAADEQDVAEIIFEIKNELSKESPAKKLIKRSLQALKGFGRIVTEKSIEYGLDNILSQL